MKKLIVMALVSFQIYAVDYNVIGQVYDVVEPDALEEMEQKAKVVNWEVELNKNQDDWSVFKGIPLPVAREDRVRQVVPFYTSPIDVYGAEGQLLYPKGYTFNPLSFVTLPQRIIVIAPGQEDWLASVIRKTDQVVYTTGNVLKKSKLIQRSPFILDRAMRSRLDLKVVPVIVEQKEQHLVLSEYTYPRPKML